MSEVCADCGSTSIRETMEHEYFPYGAGKDEVLLDAGMVPVFTCDACGFQYTDWRAEEARERAVQRHLRKLRREQWTVHEWMATLLLCLFFPPIGFAALTCWLCKKRVWH